MEQTAETLHVTAETIDAPWRPGLLPWQPSGSDPAYTARRLASLRRRSASHRNIAVVNAPRRHSSAEGHCRSVPPRALRILPDVAQEGVSPASPPRSAALSKGSPHDAQAMAHNLDLFADRAWFGQAFPVSGGCFPGEIHAATEADDLDFREIIDRLGNQHQVVLSQSTGRIVGQEAQDVRFACHAGPHRRGAAHLDAGSIPIGQASRLSPHEMWEHRQPDAGRFLVDDFLSQCQRIHAVLVAQEPTVVDTKFFAQPPGKEFRHGPVPRLDIAQVGRRNAGSLGHLILRLSMLRKDLQQLLQALLPYPRHLIRFLISHDQITNKASPAGRWPWQTPG